MITVIRHQTCTKAQPFALIYCHICIKYLSLSATQTSEFSVAITTLEIQHIRKKTNSNSAQFPLNSKDNLTIFALIQDRLITGCKNDPSNPFFPCTLALSPPPLRLQQSLIRIPLPVGHRMQESRCGPQRQRRRVVFQLLHTHIMSYPRHAGLPWQVSIKTTPISLQCAREELGMYYCRHRFTLNTSFLQNEGI